MATAADLQAISLRTYDVFFRGNDLGTTQLDTLIFNANGVFIDAEADQFVGIVQSFQAGVPVTVEMTLQNTSVEFIATKLLQGQVDFDSVGGATKMGFGNIIRKLNDTSIVGQLLLHPTGVSTTDRSNDILVHLAAPKIENLQLLGSRTAIQNIAVVFTAFPDLNQEPGEAFAILGDFSISSTTPLAVIITSDFEPTNPLIGMTAITLKAFEKERLNAFRINGDVDPGSTALLNGAIAAATDTALTFDTASSPNPFNAGDFIRINTEDIFIVSVTYTTTTSGTMVIERGAFNSVAATHSDTDPIKLISNVRAILARDTVTWASTVVGDVTVGDIFQGAVSNRKGQLIWVSDGSADISATFNAVASTALVVTAEV